MKKKHLWISLVFLSTFNLFAEKIANSDSVKEEKGAEQVLVDNVPQEEKLITSDKKVENVRVEEQKNTEVIDSEKSLTQEASSEEKSKYLKGKVVNSKRLNVRIRPSLEHEIVAIIDQGAEVQIVSEIKDWYEIVLPEKGDVWVYKDDIAPNGKVVVEHCGLRSGAGVVFNPYSKTLTEGTMVTVLQEENGWYKIVPPQNLLTAWVAVQYIKVDRPEQVKKVEEKPVEVIEKKDDSLTKTEEKSENLSTKEEKQEELKTEEKKIEKQEPIKEIIEKKEEPIKEAKIIKFEKPKIRSVQEGTGRLIWRGYIYRLSVPRGEATHQLVVHFDNGKKARIGYLSSAHSYVQLNEWKGWPVIVYGTFVNSSGSNRDGFLKVSGIQIENSGN